MTKSLQPTKTISKKITRMNKTGDLSLPSTMSSNTLVIEKSTYVNKLSGIAERVSIASSNAKVQYYQFNSIHSRDYDSLTNFSLHDLNSLPKNTH